jgi:hypothetical protein
MSANADNGIERVTGSAATAREHIPTDIWGTDQSMHRPIDSREKQRQIKNANQQKGGMTSWTKPV